MVPAPSVVPVGDPTDTPVVASVICVTPLTDIVRGTPVGRANDVPPEPEIMRNSFVPLVLMSRMPPVVLSSVSSEYPLSELTCPFGLIDMALVAMFQMMSPAASEYDQLCVCVD